jgi:SAM-dependent methyltransferase
LNLGSTVKVHPMTTSTPLEPNHHADHPGFSGASGVALALLFALGGGSRARLAADLAGVTPDDHVVDVGCGPGTAAREAARRGATATGIDPAPVMLSVARCLTRLTRGTATVRWADGRAEALPLPDGTATVVWSLATVHHWPDLDAGLAEAHRVLRPAGRLLAIERRTAADAKGLASHGWTEAQAEAFIERCTVGGFVATTLEHHRDRRGPVLVVQATRP